MNDNYLLIYLLVFTDIYYICCLDGLDIMGFLFENLLTVIT